MSSGPREHGLTDSDDFCARIDRKFDALEARLRMDMIAQTVVISVIIFALLHCVK